MAEINNKNNIMPNTFASITGASYGASGATVVWGIQISVWLSLVGVIFMALTYFTSTYYNRKRYLFELENNKREQRRHEREEELHQLEVQRRRLEVAQL